MKASLASSKKTKIIIFRPEDLQSVKPDRIAELNKKTNSELIPVTTWEDLNVALTASPDLLFFHVKVIKMFNISFTEFVSIINGLVKCTSTCKKSIRLAALITKDTTQEEILEFKKSGIAGILPSANDYGFDARANAQTELLKGNEFWPEDVIESLPTIINKNKKTIVYYQPDRYTTRVDSVNADEYIRKHADCNFVVTLTWEDFVEKLNLNPDLVGFHCDLFNNDNFGIQGLINTIETTLKLKDSQAGIFVSINKRICRDTINMLKKTNVIGLQFGRGDFGLEYAAESYRKLLEDQSHWPEDKIATLLEHQENKKPLHLYFRDDLDEYLKHDTDVTKKIKTAMPEIKIRQCKTWNDLSSGLAERPKNITFHIDMVRRHGGTVSEFMMMLDTMIKYADLPIRPNISVGIEADTHVSTIKELQKHKILGIAPSAKTFGIENSIAAIQALINDESHWPKELISKLPGNEHKKPKTGHSLTDRQQEVFDLIANRGLSNKQIARVLNISESTVKIHVSAVMKNLCVRNRTQLALAK